MSKTFLIAPGGSLNGTVKVDGDKSISHRSIIFGAIAEGKTHISDILEGEDVLATIAAFRAMGVDIRREREGQYRVSGAGIDGLKEPECELDMGNSGTAFRLLTGLLAGQKWKSRLVGDESLTGRPMGRVIKHLTQMGAVISSRDMMPPLEISPGGELKGINYEMPIASAQVKSCLMLAGLYASGTTEVVEPAPTRDHTERMLAAFGYPVNKDRNRIWLEGGHQLSAVDIVVPSDLSSATFFIIGALISKDSELHLPGVGINPTRNGVLGILRRMGANIEESNPRTIGGEPVADLIVRSSHLQGCEIAGEDIALAIDEIPAISVAAAVAEGVTEIRDGEELRVKESDRIHSTVQGLKALGVQVDEKPDGMVITGGKLSGGVVDSFHDHRIAMSFAMAGLAAAEQIQVNRCENVATSFPQFANLAGNAGLNISVN